MLRTGKRAQHKDAVYLEVDMLVDHVEELQDAKLTACSPSEHHLGGHPTSGS